MTYFLIRHGQSQANAHKIVAGSQESALSELGRLQSRLAGQIAKRFFRIDLIVTSPMERSYETARIIAQELALAPENIIVMDDLRERDLGELEGLSYAVAPHHNGNYEDAENAPGIEPIGQLYQRAHSVLEQLQTLPSKNILIITHNGIGRMLRTVSEGGQPLDLYKQPRLENAVCYNMSVDNLLLPSQVST